MGGGDSQTVHKPKIIEKGFADNCRYIGGGMERIKDAVLIAGLLKNGTVVMDLISSKAYIIFLTSRLTSTENCFRKERRQSASCLG